MEQYTLCLPLNVNNHENNYFDIHGYQKPFTYNDKSNCIKGYNVTQKTIDNIKELYPIHNSTPYYSPIANSVNCYLLKVYITSTITYGKLFTCPKKLTAYCNNVASKVKGFCCRHLFLVPEMSNEYMIKQINRANCSFTN